MRRWSCPIRPGGTPRTRSPSPAAGGRSTAFSTWRRRTSRASRRRRAPSQTPPRRPSRLGAQATRSPKWLLDTLAGAVDALRAEEDNPGGRRVRQIGHLVQELTRQEMGLAEAEAVRNSWTRFYRDTSGVLHGSGATPEESRERFEGVVVAFEQLFLGLPERAERLRQLALSEQPSPQDAAEIASMSDPRAGSYFFRAAVSRHWLGLLPLDRLLPEASRWPALPYLRAATGRRSTAGVRVGGAASGRDRGARPGCGRHGGGPGGRGGHVGVWGAAADRQGRAGPPCAAAHQLLGAGCPGVRAHRAVGPHRRGRAASAVLRHPGVLGSGATGKRSGPNCPR
ncbi:hypothetical protein SUDANB37_05750 (plasmid) [Streptomyces sp. enrichment culture]